MYATHTHYINICNKGIFLFYLLPYFIPLSENNWLAHVTSFFHPLWSATKSFRSNKIKCLSMINDRNWSALKESRSEEAKTRNHLSHSITETQINVQWQEPSWHFFLEMSSLLLLRYEGCNLACNAILMRCQNKYVAPNQTCRVNTPNRNHNESFFFLPRCSYKKPITRLFGRIITDSFEERIMHKKALDWNGSKKPYIHKQWVETFIQAFILARLCTP